MKNTIDAAASLLLLLIMALVLATTSGCEGVAQAGLESGQVVWTDAEGTAIAVLDTQFWITSPRELRYMDHHGRGWAMNPNTGESAAMIPGIYRRAWATQDCSGTEYLIGEGPMPLPRFTFTLTGEAQDSVAAQVVHMRPDQLPEVETQICSALFADRCVSISCSSRTSLLNLATVPKVPLLIPARRPAPIRANVW